MKLFSTLKSPFVRKVRVVAIEKGLHDHIELEDGHPMHDPPKLLKENPLGKVPALVLPDGTTLYDSKVICEYLDGLTDAPKLIPGGAERIHVLNLTALADGMMDASVAIVMERMRPEAFQFSGFLDRQEKKIERTLRVLDQQLDSLPQEMTLAQIGIGVALEYLKRRTPRLAALANRYATTALRDWSAEFAQRRSMRDTDLPRD